MSLPTSRDETATAASPVHSNLINNLQDCIIGGKHGDIVLAIPLFSPFDRTGGAFNFSTGVYQLGASSSTCMWGIQIPQNITVQAVSYNIYGDGTVDTTAEIASYGKHGGAYTSHGSDALTNITTSWHDQIFAGFTPFIPTIGDFLFFGVTQSGGVALIGGIQVTIRKT